MQKVSATGKVYNLNKLSDFAGTYRGVSDGLTLIEGKMHAKLTNGNGVVMYLAGQTEGLASSVEDRHSRSHSQIDGASMKDNWEAQAGVNF